MERRWFVRGMKFALLAVVACAVFGFIVMSLWNWLMPALFGWRLITFWQALGLFILSKVLFGGFRGRPGYRMHWRRRMIERWQQMSPEERDRFRRGMSARCGQFGESTTKPKAANAQPAVKT